MPSLKINTAANFVGQISNAVVAFALVPLYIKYLGVESYGLLGFFVSLQALTAVMDLGLSTTANREVARSRSQPDHIHRVLSTLQFVYFAFGILIICFFSLFAKIIATHWITSKGIPEETVTTAIILFGFTIGMRWPVGLYSGVLRGVEKQVTLNLIATFSTIVKGLGSAFIVVVIPNSLLQVISWQLLVGIGEVILYATFAWRLVPTSTLGKFTFSTTVLRSVLGFSFTVALISIFAIIIKQLDKLIISTLLPLEELGYYVTAFQAYTAIQIFINPVSTAVFPRLSLIVNSPSQEGLSEVYHKTTKVISFFSSPIAAVFIFYSYDLILLWTKTEIVAQRAHMTLSILAVAALFNSVMQASFVLQLAAGLQRLALVNNIIACLIFTPLTYFLVLKYGIIGGAISWSVYNLSYFLIMPIITHRHILQGELIVWMTKATIPFMALSCALFGISSMCTISFAPLAKLSVIIITYFVYVILSASIDSTILKQFIEIKGFFSKRLFRAL